MSKASARFVIPVASLTAIALAVAAAAWYWREPNTEAVLAAYEDFKDHGKLLIEYPLDETLFPPDITAPVFRWVDPAATADTYLVVIDFADRQGRMSFFTRQPRWTPEPAAWEAIKQRSLESEAAVTILGIRRRVPRHILSAGQIRIRTSRDAVAAPIFYREVNLPFIDAVKDPSRIRWRFGTISSLQQPPIVLEKLPVCGNCHSFSADAAVLGMDVDYANDKGSYAVTRVQEDMTLARSEIITWSDYRREDQEPTFGLLSQVSPDGRYVVSTVKDQSVFVPKPGLAFSQLFFPIKGILCIYDRQTGMYQALPGADDPNLVQSNPSWSPDGKYIVFARAAAYRLKVPGAEKKVLLSPDDCSEFLKDGKPFLYDLYRIPFNEGQGGQPEPVQGAFNNGMSNFFARYSPDGRWIVFCRAKSYMLLQPDSELYIIPAEGGEPRKLLANTAHMNSWHSWSPNGKWLVFSSKANSPYTQLLLTHIDEKGNSSPAVLLDRFTASDRAANIPEFVNARPTAIARIHEQFVDDYSYFRAGVTSLRANDPQGAEQGYRKALKLNPHNAKAHLDLAYLLLKRGEIDEGLVHVNESLRLDPNNVEARFNLAMAMALQKKPQEAATHFEKVIQLKPDHAEAHFNLAVVLANLGRLDEAVTHYLKASELNPNDARVPYNLGLLAAQQGKLDEVVKHLSRAIQIKPDYTDAYVNLGVILARQKKFDQAISTFTKATQIDSSNIPALVNLAITYDKAGQRDKVVPVLQRALDVARATNDATLVQEITKRIEQFK